MPIIAATTVYQLTAPSTPLNGVMVFSRAIDACGQFNEFGQCEIISFVNGQQNRHWQKSAYGLSEIGLPVSLDVDTWYFKQLSGDPILILCDLQNICTGMEYQTEVGQVGSGTQDWAGLITISAPVPTVSTGSSAYILDLLNQINELSTDLAQANTEIARLNQVIEDLTHTPGGGAVGELINQMQIARSC
jgi:hypothetical protein